MVIPIAIKKMQIQLKKWFLQSNIRIVAVIEENVLLWSESSSYTKKEEEIYACVSKYVYMIRNMYVNKLQLFKIAFFFV